MKTVCVLLAAISAWLIMCVPAQAQPGVHIETANVRVCPVDDPAQIPDFSGPDCQTMPLWSVDPQGRHLWVQAPLTLRPENLDGPGPFGLQVLAKASSEAWINGTYLGANGRPAGTRNAEIPGRMDSVIYVPRALVQEGENTIVLRLSAQHGFIRLAAPIHRVAFGPYRNPGQRMILAYWPSLITFGAFAIGCLFFGVTALRGEDREGSAILSAASLFAAVQLLAEVSRSLYPYPYPVHEIRLVTILACAFGFGLCLNAYLLLRLSGLGARARMLRLAGLAAIMALIVVVVPGFDGKTGFALLAAVAAGIIGSIIWSIGKRPGPRPISRFSARSRRS